MVPKCNVDKKRRRKLLTLQEKFDMIKLSEQGMSNTQIGRMLNSPRTTVSTIITGKDKVLNEIKSATPVTTKVIRKRDSLIADMEKLLIVWIEDQTSRNVPVNQPIIQAKALTLFNSMKAERDEASSKDKFEASRGWFDRFKVRCNLHNIKKNKKVVGSIREIKQKMYDSQQSNDRTKLINMDFKCDVDFKDEPTDSQDEFTFAETISNSDTVFQVNQNVEEYENIFENGHSSEDKTRFKKRSRNNVSSPNFKEIKKKTKISATNMNQNNSNLIESLNILKLASASSSERDECGTYGDHIANKLRKLDECSRAVVQHKINNIIFEAEMKKFSTTSEQET